MRPDGAVRHVRCVGLPAPSGGMDRGFVETGIDVTEQELLTSALRKGEGELRQVLDLTPQLVTVYGPKRERLYARVALAYFGINLDEWRRLDMGSDYTHPEDWQRMKGPLGQAWSHGSTFEFETHLRKADRTCFRNKNSSDSEARSAFGSMFE